MDALLAEVFDAGTDSDADTTDSVCDPVDVPPAGAAVVDVPPAGAVTASGPLAGLDPRHRGLLAELASRSSWTGGQLTALAARHAVLPAGALDLINELAIECVGQAVVEADAGAAGGAMEDIGLGQDEIWVVDLAVVGELLG